ncbi:L-type lectin-domain containing receptor kinase VIII.1-like [Nicotiana tomentosiformis]|uniref:L-type lectin-domain containing receptor kinase VIII.1-like n=1 Tax=Nicotiana tomentosiformis TaxID=4098 RepID=UPI00051ACBB9|nr:L-type lectin-domain containing receptor kinase VIII.1-like [Nicotiana tomentosiformis]
MDYYYWFFFLFAVLVNLVASVPRGPVINVTKHISFQEFSSKNPRLKQDLTLLGSAIVSDEKSTVQIPDPEQEGDLKHLAGRAIYSSPIRFFDPLSQTPASFETTFSFQFQVLKSNSSNGASDLGKSVGGSGFTFIIVPDELTVGRSGPWLGMLNDLCDDDYKSVAIEFDTRQNPEFGDPNDNHLGINLGSIVSTAAINASDVGVQLNDGSVHRVWISYDGQRRYIDIRLAPDGKEYPSKSVYSGFLDLSPYLNEYMFVGFSAATGNHTQIHNVLSWNFTSVSQASLRIPSTETCQNKIMLQNNPQAETSHSKTPNSFFIFLAVVILLVIVLINLYFSSYKRDDNSSETIILPEKKQRPRPPNKARRFTIAEISVATRNFSELQILGSDEKSVTYKATMLNGCNVVVKRFLTQFFNTHGFDKRRFHKEIKAISSIRHPNLVPVRGWCYDNQETIVVYDYIPNGSLDKWLFGVGVLPWTRRFKVVKDLADSLVYLHSKQLAHKNVKSSSVFLDVSFRAVVGDFGFVLTSTGSTRFESMVSQTADVFEFGVVVLETVAGRSRKSNPGERDLLDLAWAMHEVQQKETLVDRRMGAVVNLEQAIRVLDIGLLCTLNENKGRPTMEEVVEFLNMEKPIPELPPGRPVCLFPYNSTTGLCSGYACTAFK